MTLIDILTTEEIGQITENMPFLEPSDFKKAFSNLTLKEIHDYGYALNLTPSRFIGNMEKRAEKLGGGLI